MRVIQEHRLKKRCQCHSTASGPRLIFRDGETLGGMLTRPDTYQVIVQFVLLACDACNIEWTEDQG